MSQEQPLPNFGVAPTLADLERDWAELKDVRQKYAGTDLLDALVIRHAHVREHEDSGFLGIHANSNDEEILEYTRNQSANVRRFYAAPPHYWVIFIREGGDQSRLWAAVAKRDEIANDGVRREVIEREPAIFSSLAQVVTGLASTSIKRKRPTDAGGSKGSAPWRWHHAGTVRYPPGRLGESIARCDRHPSDGCVRSAGPRGCGYTRGADVAL